MYILRDIAPECFEPKRKAHKDDNWKNINWVDNNGLTQLSMSILRHNIENAIFCIQVLKCDVNIPQRYLPISLAVQIDNLALVEVLCQNGADLNKADFQGYYPLDRAKSQEMRDFLTKHGSVQRKK
ncbi:hypothetical protein TVAG_238250 [Trichomonas vaginalis G3]|uniref:Uncharacterized protein n=1 Tax=Trichomonas vaginalis (strain ATCC PRA-98 / G3) TaxID=412133 RepID=A2DD25_TRIV3|nr:Ankyrin repeat family [Trichomonas vaginalis G3]EAY21799.1 hypothetical protein TVAG_238250 [Trichomonas vaginalis G3]KAI5524245.1 Ankyrin repeat family [Trichomonas vaginalis G3]|eukprot:XP_001582785.1 hypothetical protein [Trichomonas vaginalis G3]